MQPTHSMYCWIEPLNGYSICIHTPPSEACGGLRVWWATETSGVLRLIASFWFCIYRGRIPARDGCCSDAFYPFHFRAGSTVALLPLTLKLNLTNSPLNRVDYRGALHGKSARVLNVSTGNSNLCVRCFRPSLHYSMRLPE